MIKRAPFIINARLACVERQRQLKNVVSPQLVDGPGRSRLHALTRILVVREVAVGVDPIFFPGVFIVSKGVRARHDINRSSIN